MRRLLLSLFGVGFVPWAPGTLASLVAILMYLGMLRVLGWRAAAIACAAVSLFFALVTAFAGDEAGGSDPRWIVSDEVAGQLLAVMLAKWPWGVLAGFLGFRVLDIAKPFPISRLERLPRGSGVVADDLAAGLVVLVVLRLLNQLATVWEFEWGLVYP